MDIMRKSYILSITFSQLVDSGGEKEGRKDADTT